MFCTNCGEENEDNSKFCKKCGSPLDDTVSEGETNNIIENSEIPNETKKSGNSKLKIIIPIAVIFIILIAVAGIMFMGDSKTTTTENENNNLGTNDSSNDNETNTTLDSENNLDDNNLNENNDLVKILSVSAKVKSVNMMGDEFKVNKNSPSVSKGETATVKIEFTPLTDIDNIRYLSLDNINWIYTDGSKSNNGNVKELAYNENFGDNILYEASSTLNTGKDYQFQFTTKYGLDQKLSHIEADIIVHTTLNGDFIIGHIDEDINSNY